MSFKEFLTKETSENLNESDNFSDLVSTMKEKWYEDFDDGAFSVESDSRSLTISSLEIMSSNFIKSLETSFPEFKKLNWHITKAHGGSVSVRFYK